MVSLSSLNVSSVAIVASLIASSVTSAEASGPGYSSSRYTPASYDTCVAYENYELYTCLGDKATCQAYFYYDGYCPGKPHSYRRGMAEAESGPGYGSPTPPYAGYAQPGLNSFLCPCKSTLEHFFDQALQSNLCRSGRGGGGYGGGGYGGGGYGGGGHSGSDYSCSTCSGPCGSYSSGGYRGRDLEGESGAGYGGSHGGYGSAAGYGAKCSCGDIENVAITLFCKAFVGDYNDYGGYGPYGGSSPGYGGSGHGYRKLDGDEDESYASANSYYSDTCTDCVHDCIKYVKECCDISVCGYGGGGY